MTSLDRAKQFLSNRSRAIALTIVPLAGLAVNQTPARAGEVPLTALNPSSCSAFALGSNVNLSSGGACADIAQSSPDSGGLLGVKLYSGTVFDSFEPGSINAFSGSGGTFGLEIYASGGTTGNAFTGSIPVSWDFSVNTSDGAAFSYLLTYDINGSPGGSFSIGNLTSFNNTSGSTISGTSSISLGSGIVSGYSVELAVKTQTPGGPSETLTLNVPTNSLDLAPASAAPEPGSIFLFGGGFAGLLLRRLRRARR